MAATKVALFVFLFFVSRSYAAPITTSILEPIIAIPTFLEEDQRNLAVLPAEANEKEEIFVPNVLLILGGYLTDPENSFSGEGGFVNSESTGRIEKRDVPVEHAIDDLETAAGTNILRPLFVYRQQLAYRQRLRDAIRRGNRL